MKKLFTILVAACMLFGCSNEKKIKISGTITHIGMGDEPIMVYLVTKNVDERTVKIDSTFLADDGSFVLKGKTAETDLFTITDKDNILAIRVFVEPGVNSTVDCDILDYPEVKIEGSKSQAIYNEYLSVIRPMRAEQENIRQDYAYRSEDYTLPEEEYTKVLEGLVLAYEQLENNINTYILDFVSAHPDNIVAAYLVYMNTNNLNNSAEIEAQLQLLDPKMDNKYVRIIKDHLEKVKKTEVGQVFPSIELPDRDGNLITIESLRGKYVFVDFWASWCRPCLAEIPNLKKAYNDFHNKGFEIFGISLDQQREPWLGCISIHELRWIHVSDLLGFNSPVAKKIAVNYVPHTFLLDPNGVILAVDLRGEELYNRLAELLQ